MIYEIPIEFELEATADGYFAYSEGISLESRSIKSILKDINDYCALKSDKVTWFYPNIKYLVNQHEPQEAV